jgi:hypothetical protein
MAETAELDRCSADVAKTPKIPEDAQKTFDLLGTKEKERIRIEDTTRHFKLTGSDILLPARNSESSATSMRTPARLRSCEPHHGRCARRFVAERFPGEARSARRVPSQNDALQEPLTRVQHYGCKRPKTTTAFGVPTYTFPPAMSGVMNLSDLSVRYVSREPAILESYSSLERSVAT